MVLGNAGTMRSFVLAREDRRMMNDMSAAARDERPVVTRAVLGLGALLAIAAGAAGTVACSAPPVPDLVTAEDPAPPLPERKSAPMLTDAASTSPWPEDNPATNRPADAGTRLEHAEAGASLEAGVPEPPAGMGGAPREQPDPGAPARPKCKGWSAIEAEPNDAPSQATPIGSAICGAIDKPGDVDRLFIDSSSFLVFQFYAQNDAIITITSPSGQVDSGSAPGTYTSWEVGRFEIVITSPADVAQDYVIERY